MTRILLSLSLLALCANVAQASPPLSKGQTRLLEKGKVIVKSLEPSDGNGVSARAMGLVDAPPAKVFDVVNDCARFKEFMPRTKNSALKKETPNSRVCFVEISMPFPLSNLQSTTFSTSKAIPGGGFERRWTLIDGTYKRNNGSWTVLPWGEGGARSLVLYWLDVNPKMMIPDAILRKAQSGSLPDVYTAIRKRVKAL